MLYFAYGSNMSLPRFQQRLPNACLHGVGSLREFQLRFHKAGRDGSAKADLLYTGHYHDRVFGVLYQLTEDEKRLLDRIEDCGVGYEIKPVEVTMPCGNQFSAFTYIALHIDRSRKPFHWYHHHVLHGAREAGLPTDYIQHIREHCVEIDNDINRVNREMMIYRSPE